MDREKPPYLENAALADHHWSDYWPAAVLVIVLAAALFGGWKLYVKTYNEWENRYGRAAESTTAPQVAPLQVAQDREAEVARIRQLRAAAAPENVVWHVPDGWKCIDGMAFKPMPGGGWENVPGQPCVQKR